MTTTLFTDAACVQHQPPDGHPERPARLEAVWRALDAPAFDGLDRRTPRAADDADFALAHPERYVEALVKAAPSEGLVQIDNIPRKARALLAYLEGIQVMAHTYNDASLIQSLLPDMECLLTCS